MNVRQSFAVLALCFALVAQTAAAASSTLVISQVYGGGGNAGATLKNDFIELFNRGTRRHADRLVRAVHLRPPARRWQVTDPVRHDRAGPLLPRAGGGGAGGTVNLPTPDATGTIAMARHGRQGRAGRSARPRLPAAARPAPSSSTSSATARRPTASKAPARPRAPANTTAVIRANGGCTDTNNNATDFTHPRPPTPRNSATAANICGVVEQPADDHAAGQSDRHGRAERGAVPRQPHRQRRQRRLQLVGHAGHRHRERQRHRRTGNGERHLHRHAEDRLHRHGHVHRTLTDNVNPAVSRTVNIQVTATGRTTTRRPSRRRRIRSPPSRRMRRRSPSTSPATTTATSTTGLPRPERAWRA